MAFLDFLKKAVGLQQFAGNIPELPKDAKQAFLERIKKPQVSEPEIEIRDELDAFLHFKTWMPVHSSNIRKIRYLGEDSALEVQFRNGNFYRIDDVSIREAEAFAKANSKGRWYWSNVRVRGKGNFWATRKPYVFLFGTNPPQCLRAGGKLGAAIRKIHNLFTQGAIRKPKFMGKKIHKILAPKWGRSH